MEVENLIPIILTVLAVSGLFLYYYLNREDNKDNTQINFDTKIDGFAPVAPNYWRDLDPKSIEKTIKPSETGKRNGSNDFPPSEETKLSPTEDTIIADIRGHYNKELSRIDEFYIQGTRETLEQRFVYHKQNMESNGYSETFMSMKGEWAAEKANFIQKVRDAISQRNRAKKRLRTFKLDNNIAVGREPQVSSKLATLFKILVPVFLFFAEFYLNYSALAGTEVINADTATYISVIVGSINVVLSFIVGYLVLTHLLNPVDATKRPRLAFYGPILALYIGVVAYVNAMMGVFRSLMQDVVSAGQGLPIQQRLQARSDALEDAYQEAVYPFDSMDKIMFDGGLLLFLGAFFAVITLIDAYFYKDPIPGYSKVGKDLQASIHRVNKLKNVDIHLFEKREKFHLHNLEMRHKSRENSVSCWISYTDNLQGLIERFNKFNLHMRDLLETSIESYRAKNRQFRKTPAPAYFNTPVDASFIKTFDSVYTSVIDEHLDDENLTQQVKVKRKEIKEEYGVMIREYANFFSNERVDLSKIVEGLDDDDE